MPTNLATLLFLLLPILQSCGQSLTENNFIEITPPKAWTPEWHKLKGKNDSAIKVSITTARVQLEMIKETESTVEYKLPNGHLLGINGGEFGGGLFYKPNSKDVKQIVVNGKTYSEKVEPNWKFPFVTRKDGGKKKGEYLSLPWGNVNSFIKINDTLYFTSGLAHMGSNYGSLTKLVALEKNKFEISKVLDLEGAPMTEIIKSDTTVFVTYDGLLVAKGHRKLISLKNQFWASLYPNSVAVSDDNHIYIGMRGCYALVDLTTNGVRCFRLMK